MKINQMVQALTNPPLTPKAKLDLKSDLRLFDANGEVRVGDVVHYNKKPCFIEWVLPNAGLVGVVTMDERHMFLKLRPDQIGCVFGKGETNG